jgi:hypothetical protein
VAIIATVQHAGKLSYPIIQAAREAIQLIEMVYFAEEDRQL